MGRDGAVESKGSATNTDADAGATEDLVTVETQGLVEAGSGDARLDATIDAVADTSGQETSISTTDAVVDVGGADRGSVDGGGSDGAGNPLAGLRIAFVGTANPSPELSLTTWLNQSTGVVPARILTSATPLTAELLASFDVLILERLVRSYSQTEAGVLTSWVSGGGAVLSITGFYSTGSDTTYTNSLLSGIGIAYGGYVLGSAGGPFYVSQLASHPVMAGITSLPFWGGFTVQPTAIADGLGINTTLAASGDQPLCVAQVRGQGRVLVWGDDWVENDPLSTAPDVRRFWLQALTWLARR